MEGVGACAAYGVAAKNVTHLFLSVGGLHNASRGIVIYNPFFHDATTLTRKRCRFFTQDLVVSVAKDDGASVQRNLHAEAVGDELPITSLV